MPYVKDADQQEIPFEAGSDTSEMAARMLSTRAKLERLVLHHLVEFSTEPSWNGLTCDELERLTGATHQSVSARIRGLVIKGLVVDSKRRRLTRSGRPAAVWVIRP